MSNEKVYGRDGVSRTPEQLARVYAKLEANESTRATDNSPGRPAGAPMGESEPERKWKWQYEQGVNYAVNLFKAAQVLQMQDAVTPEQVVFGVELTALNILNVKDMPINDAAIAAARKAAYDYYIKNIRDVK